MNKLKAIILVFAVVFMSLIHAGDGDITVNIVKKSLEGHIRSDKDIQLLSKQLEDIKMQLAARSNQVQQEYVLKLAPEIEALLIQQGQSVKDARKKSVELAKMRCRVESEKLSKVLSFLTYTRGMDSYDRDQTNKTDITKQDSGQKHTENVLELKGSIALTDKVTTSAEADATRKHELDLLRLKQGFKNDDNSKQKLQEELFEVNRELSIVNGRIVSINKKIDTWETAGNANPEIARKNIKKLDHDLRIAALRKAELDFKRKYLMNK